MLRRCLLAATPDAATFAAMKFYNAIIDDTMPPLRHYATLA